MSASTRMATYITVIGYKPLMVVVMMKVTVMVRVVVVVVAAAAVVGMIMMVTVEVPLDPLISRHRHRPPLWRWWQGLTARH